MTHVWSQCGRVIGWGLWPLLLVGCASGIMKYEKSGEMKNMSEFDQQVKIDAPSDPDEAAGEVEKPAAGLDHGQKVATDGGLATGTKKSGSGAGGSGAAGQGNGSPTGPGVGSAKLNGVGSTANADQEANAPPKTRAQKRAEARALKAALKAEAKAKAIAEKLAKKKAAGAKDASQLGGPVDATFDSSKHEPELEGQVGFKGRRPLIDPFRPGEKVVHEVSYFNVKAGELTLAVKPMAQVNGHKNYHFSFGLKTSSLFSSFYSVDDDVSSLMDFDRLTPSVFTVHVKESAQLRETRFFIDWQKMQASFWEKKVTKKDGPEERKLQWEVPDYTQDVFSSVFYMRVFPWDVGVSHAFRVTDNGENLIFRAKALRREVISTAVGELTTLVIKPDVELRGQFKPVGDIFFWITDDDRHFLVKIESKIKIGTIVSEVTQLNKGN